MRELSGILTEMKRKWQRTFGETQTSSGNVIRDDIQGMEGGNDHISLLLDASKQSI